MAYHKRMRAALWEFTAEAQEVSMDLAFAMTPKVTLVLLLSKNCFADHTSGYKESGWGDIIRGISHSVKSFLLLEHWERVHDSLDCVHKGLPGYPFCNSAHCQTLPGRTFTSSSEFSYYCREVLALRLSSHKGLH